MKNLQIYSKISFFLRFSVCIPSHSRLVLFESDIFNRVKFDKRIDHKFARNCQRDRGRIHQKIRVSDEPAESVGQFFDDCKIGSACMIRFEVDWTEERCANANVKLDRTYVRIEALFVGKNLEI